MFQQPVCQRAFPMIDVRDNAKIPDILHNGGKDKPERASEGDEFRL
jgi:hypothetical protein